jgi:rubredoxin
MSEMPQPWWKCTECGYLFQASQAPEACPSCNTKCVFIDATCYTPECGGPESGNPDPQVAAK